MQSIGTVDTNIVVLRGDTASGKSTTAQVLRLALPGKVAIVEQDYFRYQMLSGGTKEDRASDAVPIIDSVVRTALGVGYSVILEGTLNLRDYDGRLRALSRDHRGTTQFYQFDVGLEETILRHRGRPASALFGEGGLREWYDGWAPLSFVQEHRIGADQTTDDIVAKILSDLWIGHPPRG